MITRRSFLKTLIATAISTIVPWRFTARQPHVARETGAVGTFCSGSWLKAAEWDVVLTDVEIEALGRGISPVFIRPDHLVWFWPLYPQFNEEGER